MDTHDLREYMLNKDQYKLNEGLIRTTDIVTTQKLVKRSLDKLPNIYYDFIEERWPTTGEFTNVLTIELESVTEQNVFALVKLMDNLGWFPSFLRTGAGGYKYSEKTLNRILSTSDQIAVTFESKFDLEVDLKAIKNKKLYHVAPGKVIDKIRKIGLVPRSTSKIASHPERVYVALTEHNALNMAQMFMNHLGLDDLYLITIEVDDLPPFIKLYSDPNYHGMGAYTLNNIPPHTFSNIRKIEEE